MRHSRYQNLWIKLRESLRPLARGMSTRQGLSIAVLGALLLSLLAVILVRPLEAKNGQSAASLASKALFFASDGMRPDLVDKYAGQGAMPTYASLIQQGLKGDNGLTQAFPRNGFAEAHRDGRPRFRLEDVPHLCLPPRLMVLARVVVIRMHLHGQPAGAIEQLDEERKPPSEPRHDVATEEVRAAVVRDLPDRLPGVRSRLNPAVVECAPQLADRWVVHFQSLAAPHALAILRLELKQFLAQRSHDVDDYRNRTISFIG